MGAGIGCIGDDDMIIGISYVLNIITIDDLGFFYNGIGLSFFSHVTLARDGLFGE